MQPLISVVIPTHRRPQLVKRAVRSALAQTLHDIEVIVVINGVDEQARESLAEIQDPRLKVIELPVNLGGASPARNAGAAIAQADWIAHLDDDDEWLPHKLERQFEAAKRSPYQFPIVTCYLKLRTQERDTVLPRRVPTPLEPLSEYLFVRNTYFQGEGLIQGSTLLTPKKLLEKVPFNLAVGKHDDWDWLLQASVVPGVGFEFVPEPLSIWYMDEQRSSASRTHNWQFSLDWIRSRRDLVTPRAYAAFLLIEIASHAAFNRDWQAFPMLLREAIQYGAPKPIDFGLFLGMWMISPDMRSWLRTKLTNKLKPSFT